MNRWFELKGDSSGENEWHLEMYYSTVSGTPKNYSPNQKNFLFENILQNIYILFQIYWHLLNERPTHVLNLNQRLSLIKYMQ